jgi:hypothetical protein
MLCHLEHARTDIDQILFWRHLLVRPAICKKASKVAFTRENDRVNALKSYAVPAFPTEHRDRVVSTRASNSGGPGFKSRPPNRLGWQRFLVDFPSPSKQMPVYCLKVGYSRSLQHPFQFINQSIIRRCIV